MNHRLGRRTFLQTSSAILGGAALTQGLSLAAWAAEKAKTSSPSAEKIGWLVGVQTYTFRRFSLFEALPKIAALGVCHIETAHFLPLDKARPTLMANEDLSPEGRKELKARLADNGISLPSLYAAVTADKDRAKRIFEFAKEMGSGTIVSEPPADAFDNIEKLCDEYKINLAVHNHPESPKQRYWRPEDVLAVCKGRGKRIGACCDTGHWVRSGLDPVECLKQLEGRVVSFHLKDVAEKGNRKSEDAVLGEGVSDYAAVLKELKRQGYRGVLMVEYEKDGPNLETEVAGCVAFVEKTAKTFPA